MRRKAMPLPAAPIITPTKGDRNRSQSARLTRSEHERRGKSDRQIAAEWNREARLIEPSWTWHLRRATRSPSGSSARAESARQGRHSPESFDRPPVFAIPPARRATPNTASSSPGQAPSGVSPRRSPDARRARTRRSAGTGRSEEHGRGSERRGTECDHRQENVADPHRANGHAGDSDLRNSGKRSAPEPPPKQARPRDRESPGHARPRRPPARDFPPAATTPRSQPELRDCT